MTDTEVRQLHFIEEIAVRKNKPEPKPKVQPKKTAWGGGEVIKDKTKKGLGKGAKGKEKAGRSKSGKTKVIGGLEVVRETPDRRFICFKWNLGEECDGQCGMVHCCRVLGCLATDHCMIHHPGFRSNA